MSVLLNDRPGDVRRVGDHYEITFVRRFARPVEKVWAALTTPARLADWLAQAEIDLRVGGRFSLYWPTHDHRMEGVITELDPPNVFAWTWPAPEHPDSVVRWTLAPDGDGCRLTLTQSGLTAAPLKDAAAGWHTHMEGLAAAIDGIATAWDAGRERENRGLYEELPSA
ncbi:MAG: SRPBCC family protein [Proteobacteria bacterium]|nr:SRPBCC family protein [Pseudomonadota bacterium]